MTDVEKKRRGRPPKPPVEGERIPLSLRVTADLKRNLERSAGGRSLSQEAEYRLNRSFAEEDLFASRSVKIWAILLAEEFRREGVSVADHLGVDAEGDAWMKSPECLVPATFSVIDRLLQEAERQPGADVGLINMWMEQLMARFLHRSGKLKFFDKDGKEMKSGFFDPNEAKDGTR